MINSIELTDWKTHGSTRLEFSKGTNILIGQMGAGKSSIMDAISFGLFGTFPAVKNRRVSVNGLIRNRPSQKRTARVRISFTVGGDSYVVEREAVLNGQAKASLTKNGVHLQSQPQRVTEEVERALMMDYDLFSRAVYSEQNRLDYFLELSAANRKKQIDNLLGLDRFATAQENTTSLINRVKDTVEEGRKAVESFDVEGQKAQLAALEDERRRAEEESARMRGSVAALGARRKSLEDGLRTMREGYNRKIAISREIAELESRRVVLEKEVSKIDSEKLGSLDGISKELEAAEAEALELGKRRRASLARMQEAQKKLGSIQGELARVEKDSNEKRRLEESVKGKDRKKAEEEMDRHKADLEALEKELASAEAHRGDAEKWIGELERHTGRCPVCERDMDDRMRKELLEVKKKIAEEMAGKAKEMRDRRKAGKTDIERLNELLNRLSVADEKLREYADLGERRAKAEREMEGAKTEGEVAARDAERMAEGEGKARERALMLRNSRTTLERRRAYLSELGKTHEDMGRKRKELDGIEVDEKAMDLTQKEFVSVSSEMSAAEATLESMKKSLGDNAARIEERRKELERMGRIHDEIESRRKVAENLARFSNSLQETQAHLRNRLVGSVNSIMGEIWPELYPYGDYTGVELRASEDDYSLRLCTYNGEGEAWEDVDAIASGGERSIACLAMRVAFAMVLVPNLKWLILDEPTHNIDRQGIQKFVGVFNEKLPKIVEQIFIITHDEQLRQVSNGKIYMLSRDKSRNEQTSAEEM